MNNAIDRHFLSLESSVRSSIETIKTKQKKSLKDYCDKHIKQYGKQVEKLIEQQTREKARGETWINTNNNYINKISKLQESIQAEIGLLLIK